MSPADKKKALESLAEHPGYLILQGVLQEQVDGLQQEILFTICGSLDMAIKAEYKKGQLEGRLAVEELRKTAIDNFKLDIERTRENERTSDDTGTSRSSGSSDERNAP